MCCQDAPEKGMTPTALWLWAELQILSQSLSLDEGREAGLQRWQRFAKNAERLKFPKCTVLCMCGWTEGSLIEYFPWTLYNPDRSFAAVWLFSGGWGEAGEVFLDMRGSSSFGGMEGFKERRGEHSFKVLWRLAAVGRAAVFPKSPPNRKTVFFSIAQEQPLPHSRKQGPALNSQGGKNHKSFY